MAMTRDDIDTPAVLIDVPRAERNLRKAQAHADSLQLRLRPHIKTHKLPRLAQLQVALGSCGITCQKLGEAEIMADAGLSDILLTFNIIGAAKLARLKALADRITLSVVADSAYAVGGYAETFANGSAPMTVLVECDTGMGRCGVQIPHEALTLARQIDAAPGLHFGGLMTYPPAGRPEEAADWLRAARSLLSDAGLPPERISSGGTPDLWPRAFAGIATEHRPGTYIYMDRSMIERGTCTVEDCALSVLATVVSAPAPGRIVVDAGSKTLSSDTMGMQGFGLLPAFPEARIGSLSEEHGVIDVSACAKAPGIGEKILIIPNHACVVTNLFDHVHLIAADGAVERVRVDARGRVD